MSTTDTKVDELIINTLTKAQYDNLVANNQVEANQLYLTKDEDYYMQIAITYGTTTYAQITSALGAKQEPVCNYNSYQYTYAGNDGTYYYFTCAINNEIKYIRVNSSNIWSNGTAIIPTVNNATITLTQGGENKGSFTLNQSNSTTIALDRDTERNIGQVIFSLIPLTDAGVHLLDGALLDGTGTYSAFYNYMLNLYGESNHPNYFTSETAWQDSITSYGVCGKFVIDTTNQTIRLPKVTGIVEGTLSESALGDLVQAGLPNITGSFGKNEGQTIPIFSNSTFSDGAFNITYMSTEGYNETRTATQANRPRAVSFDASRSNSIYNNSNTVQPQTIKGFYYIVIATSVKTNIQVDIDEIATDLNNKADKDFSNCEAQDKINLAIYGLPSSTRIELTLGSSGTVYTMTDNGWLYISKSATTSGQYCNFSVKDSNDNYSYDMYGTATSRGDLVKLLAPVKKGWKVTITYDLGGSSTYFFLIKSGV